MVCYYTHKTSQNHVEHYQCMHFVAHLYVDCRRCFDNHIMHITCYIYIRDIILYYISNSILRVYIYIYIIFCRFTYIITYVYLFSFVSWRIPLNLHPGATAPVRVIALHSIKGATLLLLSLTDDVNSWKFKTNVTKKWVTKIHSHW